jgi:hypothetical protein
MPGRYGFHSTRPAPWEASQCGVERRPPVQGRSELQAHDTTVLQCLAVEVREGLGRSPGPRHTSPASFLGTPQDSGRSPCVMPRRRFRPSVSQLSGDLLDHELPSAERDRVTGALALQLDPDEPRRVVRESRQQQYRDAGRPPNVWDGEKSIRPDLNVKLPESSISATRVLVRSLALARLGAHVSPIFFEVAKSLTSVSTNQTVSPEERRLRWSGSVTTSRTRSTWPDVRNCFVIFLSAAGLAARLP